MPYKSKKDYKKLPKLHSKKQEITFFVNNSIQIWPIFYPNNIYLTHPSVLRSYLYPPFFYLWGQGHKVKIQDRWSRDTRQEYMTGEAGEQGRRKIQVGAGLTYKWGRKRNKRYFWQGNETGRGKIKVG